jgi:hypothetical protein
MLLSAKTDINLNIVMKAFLHGGIASSKELIGFLL